MALVLDAFRYADRLLLSFHEGLRDAPVYVHLLRCAADTVWVAMELSTITPRGAVRDD